MKRIWLLLLIVCISIGLHSQAWKRGIKKENPNFFDLQKAFNKECEGKDITTVNGWKQFKRWEWFMENRINTDGYLDSMKLWQAIKTKRERFGNSKNSVVSNWTEIGPKRIPGGRLGGGLGRINCITFDPVNTDIIWVCSPSGGLWKSTNGGLDWSTNTDDLANIGVSWILIDPANRQKMYIATGDGDAGDTYSIGVLKSTDGGDSWQTTGLQPDVTDFLEIRKILFHPNDSNTILAATNDGIYKTTDGGASWTIKQTGIFKDIEVNPATPSIWYAAKRSYGVFKSTDSGDTWTQLLTGLPTSGVSRIELVIAPSRPSTVYALYSNLSFSGFYGLYRSKDNGSTWTLQADTPNLLGWDYNGSDRGGQGWYDLTLAVNPVRAYEVYVGGVNIWKSGDAGVTWDCVAHWVGDNGIPEVHADHHFLEFQPGSSTVLFSGNDGGIFKSTNSGSTWTDLSEGLGIHQIYRLGGSEVVEDDILVGAQDNGSTLLTGENGKGVLAGDGMECAIDPLDPDVMYCEYYYGLIHRSVDHGETIGYIGSGLDYGAWITPFLIDPNHHKHLYIAASYVYKSEFYGNSWFPISPELTEDNIRSLAVAPSNSDYIYAADLETINVTTNGGTSWTALSGSGAPQDRISYLAVDPETPTTLWATHGGYEAGQKVYRSNNAGSSWTNISGNLPNIPVNCVAVDHTTPSANKPVYIGTDLGVFISEDGTGNWKAFGTGLPNVIVSELEIHTSSRKLRASTYGRGVWESPVAEVGQFITVNGPDGGENWMSWTTQTISWTAQGITGNVTIDLYKGGTFDSTIAVTGATAGSYSWTIPGDQAVGSDYKVRIRKGGIDDYSNDTFSIAAGIEPELTISRGTLNFGAVGANVTSAQTVFLNHRGSIDTDWTTSSDQTWLTCTPASGTNSGVLTHSVEVSGLAAGSYTGTVTITDTSALNAPLTVAVILTVYNAGGTSAPFGEFLTPTGNSTLRSSIPVTGWVLDDIGLEKVEIYSGETYVGEAVFVEGARPDLETEYANYPGNYKAGWGYMLLSYFLPGGGNGNYTLSAFAVDMEGNRIQLGSSEIIIDNDNAENPFGAIDTPAQGGSASGSDFQNSGWALTPMPYKIQEDGSTLYVYVDGVYKGKPQYNISRSDISAYFPGYANSSGPAAVFTIDTLNYSNGVHYIYWLAMDNGNRADGIGSRFFTIQNSGESGDPEARTSRTQSNNRYSKPPVIRHEKIPVELSSPVGVITGIGNSVPRKIVAGEMGVYHLRVRELERVVIVPEFDEAVTSLESPFGNITGSKSESKCRGYLLVGDRLKPLPAGSTLDSERGVFYWHPGPGFLGKYTFLFILNKGGQPVKKVFEVEILPGM